VPESVTSFSHNGRLGSQEVAHGKRETVTVWRMRSTLALTHPSVMPVGSSIDTGEGGRLEVKASNHCEEWFAAILSDLPE